MAAADAFGPASRPSARRSAGSRPRAAIATLLRLLGDPDPALIEEWAQLALSHGMRVDGATAPLLLDWWARQPRRSESVFAALGPSRRVARVAERRLAEARGHDGHPCRCRRGVAVRQECGAARDPDVRSTAGSGQGPRARRIDLAERRRQRSPAVPGSARRKPFDGRRALPRGGARRPKQARAPAGRRRSRPHSRIPPAAAAVRRREADRHGPDNSRDAPRSRPAADRAACRRNRLPPRGSATGSRSARPRASAREPGGCVRFWPVPTSRCGPSAPR